MKFEPQSIELVRVNLETSQFIITEKGRKFLQSIDRPIGIVTIAGIYRSGKSYLINKLIDSKQNKGFETGSTTKSVTKGLNVWGQPIRSIDKNGREFQYILIDSEGLGSLEQQMQYDINLLLLIFLISSIVVYNSVGAIDEISLDQLRVILNLKKCLRSQSSQQPSNPKFIWILRDFSLQLINKMGYQMSPDQYMQQCLEEISSTNPEVIKKNQIRKAIKDNLVDRSCYTLVRPTMKQDDLINLDKCKVRTQFLTQIQNVKQAIFSNHWNDVKKINGRDIDGKTFVKIIQQYIQIINHHQLPNVSNVWESVHAIRLQQSLEQCCGNMAKQLKSIVLPLSEEQLKRKLNQIQNKYYNQFSNCLEIDSKTRKFQRDFIKSAQKINRDIKQHNYNIRSKGLKQQLIQFVQTNINYQGIKPTCISAVKPFLETLYSKANNNKQGCQYMFQIIKDILHIIQQKSIQVERESVEMRSMLEKNSNDRKQKDIEIMSIKHQYHEALKQISQLKNKICILEKEKSTAIENAEINHNDKEQIWKQSLMREKQYTKVLQDSQNKFKLRIDQLNNIIKTFREQKNQLEEQISSFQSKNIYQQNQKRKQFIFEEKINQSWNKFQSQRKILNSKIQEYKNKYENQKSKYQKLQHQCEIQKMEYQKNKNQFTKRQKQFERQLIDLQNSIRETKKSYQLTYQTKRKNDIIMKDIENITGKKPGLQFQQQQKKNILKNYYQSQLEKQKWNFQEQLKEITQEKDKKIQELQNKQKKYQLEIKQLKQECRLLRNELLEANQKFNECITEIQNCKEKERSLYQQSIVRLLSNIQKKDRIFGFQTLDRNYTK